MARKLPFVEPVAVVWIDATKKDHSAPHTAPAVTFGVLIKNGGSRGDSITVASEAFYDDDKRNFTTIPKGMVKRVIHLAPSRGKGILRLPEFVWPMEEGD